MPSSKTNSLAGVGANDIAREPDVNSWRELLSTVPDMPWKQLEAQLKIIRRDNLQIGGLTPAERILPARLPLARGLEAHVILPGTSPAVIEKTAGIVAQCFESPPDTPEELLPVNTWRHSLGDKLSGRSYFIETCGPLKGYIGVFDCFLLYAKQLPGSEAVDWSRIEPVGIHGLYHYLLKPARYHGVRWAVAPRYQGQGIGKKIFSHNLHLVLQLSGTSRWVFTESDPGKNAGVLRTYRRWGFRRTGITFSYNNVDQEYLCMSLAEGSAGRTMAASCFIEDGDPLR